MIVIVLTFLLVSIEQYLGINDNATAVESEYYLENQEDAFNNIETVSSLVISNIQDDEEFITYTYKISVKDASGSYRYSRNNQEGYIVFSANGEAQILLNSNESYTIYDLPTNAIYEIVQNNNISDKYITTANGEDSITVTGLISSESKAVFDNKKIIEETPIVEEKPNPVTADYIIIPLIISIIFGIALVIAKKIKFKRFV